MTSGDFNFNFYNTNFYGQYFQPENANAVIILVHGMGEHLGRYTEFVIPKLISSNFAVVAYDQFGHGKTSGKRGHNPSYNFVLDSLQKVIEEAKKHFSHLPIFLYGHSMGGNVVLNYALQNQNNNLTGIIATSPLLRLAFQPPKWKLSLGKIIQKIAPSVTLKSELDTSALSRDKEAIKKYEQDKLVHDKISANYSLTFFEKGEWAIKNAYQLTNPTLIIHGTADKITDHKASQEVVKNSNNKATLNLFENGYHELHNDLEKEKLLQTIINWINTALQ